MPSPTFFATDPTTGEIVDRRAIEASVLGLFGPLGPGLERTEVGTFRLRSRSVTVVDRGVVHKQPFVREVPRGEYPVEIVRRVEVGHASAVIVRFSREAPVRVERAARMFPYVDERTFAFPGGVGALLDYDAVNALDVRRGEELAALVSLAPAQLSATLCLPRVRAWNGVVFRAPEEPVPYCSAFWGFDSGGGLAALAIDLADVDLAPNVAQDALGARNASTRKQVDLTKEARGSSPSYRGPSPSVPRPLPIRTETPPHPYRGSSLSAPRPLGSVRDSSEPKREAHEPAREPRDDKRERSPSVREVRASAGAPSVSVPKGSAFVPRVYPMTTEPPATTTGFAGATTGFARATTGFAGEHGGAVGMRTGFVGERTEGTS